MDIEGIGKWVLRLCWRLGLSGPTAKGEPEYVLSQDGYKEYRFTRKRYIEEFTGSCVRTGGAQRTSLTEVKAGDKPVTVWLEAVPVKESSACGCQRVLRLIYKDEPLRVDIFEQHEHVFPGGDYKTRMYVSELEEFLCDALYSELSRHTLTVSGRGPLVTCRASHEGTCSDQRHMLVTEIELDLDLEHKRADLRVKESSLGSKSR
jgi:hypothetical protein